MLMTAFSTGVIDFFFVKVLSCSMHFVIAFRAFHKQLFVIDNHEILEWFLIQRN